MKIRDKAYRYALVAVVVCGGSMLRAEPGPDPDPASRGAQTMAKLSLTEMLTRSGELTGQVKGDLRHVQHLQDQARKQKDIIKLNCVNDKFVEIKAQANVFDTVRGELESLLGGADNSDRQGVFANVVSGAASVHKTRLEADSCIGEPELGKESSNGFDHPAFPVDPTLGNPFGNPVEPPGYASPYN